MYSILRYEMEKIGMTQGELAKKVWLTQNGLSRRMTGKTEFTLMEAVAIKEALGSDLPLEQLFSTQFDAND